MKRGTVWGTRGNGTKRVYDSKGAAQSQNEGPTYEEPAEWWDLEGCEPVGISKYRRINPDTDDEERDDPLRERINGVVRPDHHGPADQQNYSESESENATARRHSQWGYATHNRKYASRLPSASEEWYTPPKTFHAMGCTFDLDPASPGADVVHWIPAIRHFTFYDNGLKKDWDDAFVWLHPPYTK